MFAKFVAALKSGVAKLETFASTEVHEIISPITAIRNKLVGVAQRASSDAASLKTQATTLEAKAVQAAVIAANLSTLTTMPTVAAVAVNNAAPLGAPLVATSAVAVAGQSSAVVPAPVAPQSAG